MKKNYNLKICITILFSLAMAACSQSSPGKPAPFTVTKKYTVPQQSLTITNGKAFLNNKLFTGNSIDKYSSGIISKTTEYKNGLEDGFTTAYYPNGKKESHRFYTKGEKDGIHTGWWPNGNKRFEYHFNNGVYEGAYTEWYDTGEMAKKLNYSNGIETDGMGWRENGKVYMSFVIKDGRRYGLVNAKLCYSLKNEKGEYVKSMQLPGN